MAFHAMAKVYMIHGNMAWPAGLGQRQIRTRNEQKKMKEKANAALTGGAVVRKAITPVHHTTYV